MHLLDWRNGLLLALALGAIIATFWLPPIPQDPTYHAFADQRTLLGIANFWNIVSNVPFVIVGAFGFSRLTCIHPAALRTAYLAICVGTVCVGFGSAYYHSAPTTATLVWDRLPMSVAFMGLFTLILHDRISTRLARRMFWPLLAAGIASVIYWYLTEQQHQGDLRTYALIQFLPMLLIPLILLLYSGTAIRTPWAWATVAAYLLAKVAEQFDIPLYHLSGSIGGHSLKHVLGAFAVLCIILAAQQVCPEQPH